MEITKLAPNAQEIVKRFEAKRQNEPDKDGPILSEISAMLMCLVEHKKLTDQIANHPKDSTLQRLPLDYYQVCARQLQLAYERGVAQGIPRLLAMGIINQNGTLL